MSKLLIRIVGVGGAGCNALDELVAKGVSPECLVAVDTSERKLTNCKAGIKVSIGGALTRGHGTGGNADLGRKAARAFADAISEAVVGMDLVIVVAGLGAGTGAGAISEVTRTAKMQGALTLSYLYQPFPFEGLRKKKAGELAMKEHWEASDAVVTLSNEKLLMATSETTSLLEAFEWGHGVMVRSLGCFLNLIAQTGFVNVDFADIRAVLHDAGPAHIGVGEANGENRIEQAFDMALSAPLCIDFDVNLANRILVNVASGSPLTMRELGEVGKIVESLGSADCLNKVGLAIDSVLDDRTRVTILAGRGSDAYGSANLTATNTDAEFTMSWVSR